MAQTLPGIPDHAFRERLGTISRPEDGGRYCANTGAGWEEREAPKPLPRVSLAALLAVAAVVVCAACLIRLGIMDRTPYGVAHVAASQLAAD